MPSQSLYVKMMRTGWCALVLEHAKQMERAHVVQVLEEILVKMSAHKPQIPTKGY